MTDTEADCFQVRGPAEVHAARKRVRALLAGNGIAGDVVDDVLLCLSEAVSNGVVRAPDGTVEVRVVLTCDQVRVEVADRAPLRPHLVVPVEALAGAPEPTELDDHGRGLFLLAALACRWGVEQERAGKCVWFSLSVPALAAVGPAVRSTAGERA